MAIELKQQLKLTQQLVMTPQLQQAIKLLQMSRMELVDMVRDELLENPVLEDQQDGNLAQEAPAVGQETPEANTIMLHNALDWMGEPALPLVKKYIQRQGNRQGRYGIGILGRIAELNGW